MKLGTPLHLAGLSLSSAGSFLETFGGDRARSTMVEETVIRRIDEHYWLSAAVDPDSNDVLRTTLDPTRTNARAHAFAAELRENHDVEDAESLVDGATPPKDARQRRGLDFGYGRRGNRNSVDR